MTKNAKSELREELKALERVDSVITLLDIPLLRTSGLELSKITEENVKTLEDPAIDTEKAKKEILESPVYKNLVLSLDGQTTALIIYLKTDTYFSELLKKRNQQTLTTHRSKNTVPLYLRWYFH